MKFKRFLKHIVFCLLLVGLFLIYSFTGNRNYNKSITDVIIDFQDNTPSFLSESMVNKLLIQNLDSIQNQPKTKLDLYRLEKAVSSNPYVENASVYMTINGKLQTSIQERTPLARVFTDKEVFYIDKEGVKVPLSTNYSARVPLITGFSSTDNLEEVFDLITYISKDEFLNKEVTEVHKNNSEEFFLLVRSGDYKINFGNLKDKEKKFKKLKTFYGKVLLDKSIYKYKTINLKYHNQVVGEK